MATAITTRALPLSIRHQSGWSDAIITITVDKKYGVNKPRYDLNIAIDGVKVGELSMCRWSYQCKLIGAYKAILLDAYTTQTRADRIPNELLIPVDDKSTLCLCRSLGYTIHPLYYDQFGISDDVILCSKAF